MARSSAPKKLKISDDMVLQPGKNILSRPSPDGKVSILNLSEVDAYYTIEGLAAKVWLALDGRKTIGEIKRQFLSDKRLKITPPKLFEGDVDRLCTELVSNRLAAVLKPKSGKT